MPFPDWIAVVAAAVAAFALGGLWYSPLLFAKTWVPLAHPGKSMEDLREQGAGWLGYGMAFATAAVAAATIGWFAEALGGGPSAGIRTGVYAGVGFVATTFATNYFFAGKPAKLYAIDAGYQVSALVLAGIVYGLWPW